MIFWLLPALSMVMNLPTTPKQHAQRLIRRFLKVVILFSVSPDECWLFTFVLIYLESQLIKLFPSATGLFREGACELETLPPHTHLPQTNIRIKIVTLVASQVHTEIIPSGTISQPEGCLMNCNIHNRACILKLQFFMIPWTCKFNRGHKKPF